MNDMEKYIYSALWWLGSPRINTHTHTHPHTPTPTPTQTHTHRHTHTHSHTKLQFTTMCLPLAIFYTDIGNKVPKVLGSNFRGCNHVVSAVDGT